MPTEPDSALQFHRYLPEHGRVFDSLFSFDTETTLIDEENPWITPAYVLGAAFDGKQGYYVERQHLKSFLENNGELPVIMHNAAFDLDVINVVVPKIDIYRLVDSNLVWDTQLLHQLYRLAAYGDVADGKGQSTLDHCARTYLHQELPKDVTDSKGRPVRLSYGQWLNRPFSEIEEPYLHYLKFDAMTTFRVYEWLRPLLESLLRRQSETWGFVSEQWLAKQIEQRGPQTHHIQLKASIVLRAITANGLRVDVSRRDELEKALSVVVDEQLAILRQYGYQPGHQGCGKALQEILREIAFRHPDIHLERTERKGQFRTNLESLQVFQGIETFIDAYLGYVSVQKLLSTFVRKMHKPVLHPRFRTLVRSGRTASSGDINAQNLPRDDRVRSCFVPRDGDVFIDVDYSAIEMTTLAQSIIGQLGLPSALGNAINNGADPHRIVAARLTGKVPSDVTKDDRQKAKAINFGLPGGMGLKTLTSYAKASYGVTLTEDAALQWKEAWHEEFPEMQAFLDDGHDVGLEAASYFDLTPVSYYDFTGNSSFLDRPDNAGREDDPHSIMGSMCLKVLRETNPERGNGQPYSPEEIDYFWSRVIDKLDELPTGRRSDIQNRHASLDLYQELRTFFGRAPVFTLTGRLRANATYSARHNAVFQGLAADGAKLGLWHVWRAGYSIHNFIHDEQLVAVPAKSNLALHAEIIAYLMRRGMSEVVPDVRVGTEYVITDRWYKMAKLVLNDQGNFLPWSTEIGAKTVA